MSEPTKFAFRVQVEELILDIDSKLRHQDKLAVHIAIDSRMIEPNSTIMMTLEDLTKAVAELNRLSKEYYLEPTEDTHSDES